MMRNGSKECATCQALTCDPCPAMEGEDGAVLGLLERLCIEGHPVIYSRSPRNRGGNWVVASYTWMPTEEGEEFGPPVRGEASTLYQALLLAAEALAENEKMEAHDEK